MAAGMGDDTRRFSSGDRWIPTSSALNGWQDAADYVHDLDRGGGSLPGPAGTMEPTIVRIKNTTGADLDRFSILGIDGPIFSPSENLDTFKTRLGLNGVFPTLEDHRGKFVVLLRPLAQGAVGPAAVAGVVPVRVYVNSPDHTYCDVIAKKTVGGEDCYLGSGGSGAQILWLGPASSGDIAWAIVRLGAGGSTPFELKTSLEPGGTADAWSVHIDQNAGEYADPDRESNTDLVLFDFQKCFCAIGYDDTAAGESGARGECNADGGIIHVQQQAKVLGGSAAVDGSGNLTQVQNLYVMDAGQLPAVTSLTPNTTPPLNPNGWKTQASADVTMLWDESARSYKVIDCSQCPA